MLRTFLLILVLLPLLTSCGLANRFFTTNECEGDNCEAPVLLDNTDSEKKWFCYGSQVGEEWQCQNEEDPTKITTVEPKPARQAVPQAPIDQPTMLAESAPELPRTQQPDGFVLESQILDMPADHYAVQLIALRDLNGVLEYAGLNGIQSPKFVKIRNDETDWYVLILDTYPDRALAEAAKENWETAKVLRVQPWIRQLGPLQEAILATRG
jgi:septal ring-binding cell division protein DamX